MSTKGTVTCAVQTFVPWNGQQSATPDQCCSATGELDSNDTDKISIVGAGTTDFEIDIGSHGKDTSLAFVITAGNVSSSYSGFIPIGIALKESDAAGTDPTGTIEFPSVTIEDDKDGNRVLTLDVVEDKNEAVTWDFFLVIQGTPAAGATTGYDIGIIDPKIKGTTAQ